MIPLKTVRGLGAINEIIVMLDKLGDMTGISFFCQKKKKKYHLNSIMKIIVIINRRYKTNTY